MKKAKLIYGAHGKKQTALRLAGEIGTYMVVKMDHLLTESGRSVLLHHPKTVIVRGFDVRNTSHVMFAKTMVDGGTMTVKSAYIDVGAFMFSCEDLMFLSKRSVVELDDSMLYRVELVKARMSFA